MNFGIFVVKKIDWTSVDWNRATKEIATELGVGKSTVSRARRRHSPETLGLFNNPKNAKEGRGRTRKYDWDSVDWSQSNRQIARQLGASLAYISRMRGELAPGTGPNIRWSKVDWSLKTGVLADKFQVHRSYVTMMRKKHAPGSMDSLKGLGSHASRRTKQR